LRAVGLQAPASGDVSADRPDLLWKGRVTEPRQNVGQVRSAARALSSKLRSVRTLKYASGMTSTHWKAAAHRATGGLADGPASLAIAAQLP
jgi:hypothetical protein